MRHRSLILSIALVATSPVQASADPLANPVDPAALDKLKQGNRHLDLEHYDEAIAAYEAGALIEPAPIFWLNIGLAHRKAERFAEAARAYRTFLIKTQGDPSSAEVRAQVEEIVRAMEEAATKPPTEPAPVANESAPLEPARAESAFTTSRKIGVGFGVVGVASVGVGLAFGVQSQNLEDDAATLCPMTVCADADAANALRERARARATYANVALGVGAAAAIGAAVLWLVGGPDEDQPSRVAVVPHVVPGEVGALIEGRF